MKINILNQENIVFKRLKYEYNNLLNILTYMTQKNYSKEKIQKYYIKTIIAKMRLDNFKRYIINKYNPFKENKYNYYIDTEKGFIFFLKEEEAK